MLPSAERQGSSAYCWKTMPRSSPGPATRLPSTRISPLLGSLSPARRSSSVDFPQPLGPARTRNSPSPTSRLMSRTAAKFLRPRRGPSVSRTENSLLTWSIVSFGLAVVIAATSCKGVRVSFFVLGVEFVGVQIARFQLAGFEFAFFFEPFRPGGEFARFDHAAGIDDA